MFQHKQPTAVTSVPEGGSVMAHATVNGSTGKTGVARAKELIAQHQLIAFFVLAFVFSWATYFAIPASNAFSTLGNYGPFAAAVLMSAFLAPGKVIGGGVRRWALFAVVFAVAVPVWIVFDSIAKTGLGWPAGLS